MELKDEQEHLCLAIGYLKAKLPENYDSGNSNTTDLYRSLHTQFEMSNSNIQKYELFNRLVKDFLTSSGKTVSTPEYHQSELEIYRDIKGLGKSNRFKGYLELCHEEDNIQSKADDPNETEMKKEPMFQVLDYLDKKLTKYNEGNESDTTNLKVSLQQLNEDNESDKLEIKSVDSLVQEFLLKKTERSSGYYLSAVEVYTGISQHLTGSRFYWALDRIKCFKREGYLWNNIYWDNEAYQKIKRIAEEQEQDQDHLCTAIGYLKAKLLELHERGDSNTTNSDVSSHKQYDMGDSISEKNDLFERLVGEFLNLSGKKESSIEYYESEMEIYREVKGLGNGSWFELPMSFLEDTIESKKERHNQIEKKKGEMRQILGYLKQKFLERFRKNDLAIEEIEDGFQKYNELNESNKLGIKSVDNLVKEFLTSSGKTDHSYEYYQSAVKVYTGIKNDVKCSIFSSGLKVRIDYSRWLAHLRKTFPAAFSEMYNDDEKLLCESIGDLDDNKLVQMAEKLLKLSNKNHDSYGFFEEAVKVYTELYKLVDCPSMDGICSGRIIHYQYKLLNLAMKESTMPDPFFMKCFNNYLNALNTYRNDCELNDIKMTTTQEFQDCLSFYFINKPINKQDEQSEWASDIYERYKEPNKEILNTIDSLVKIQAGNKKGDPYKTEIEKENQEQLMSMLTGGDFACIDYDVDESIDRDHQPYHQYVFVNQKHLQIRIKLYKEAGHEPPAQFTIGFYKDNPIDWDKDGPKLKIMESSKGKEFLCTNLGNEIIKYSNGCLITAFKKDNAVVGWDIRVISKNKIEDIDHIYTKIMEEVDGFENKKERNKYVREQFGSDVEYNKQKKKLCHKGVDMELSDVKELIKKVRFVKFLMDPAHMSLNIDSHTMKEELDKMPEESVGGNMENNKISLTRFSMFKHEDPEPKVKSLHNDYEKIEVKTRYNGDEITMIYKRNNKELELISQQGPKGMC